jgi:UDP:flavonoid glycosyltransferase YjiC (YdhE family)
LRGRGPASTCAPEHRRRALRAAVREVLNDDRDLRRARDLEAAFARRDGVAEIVALVDEVIRERNAVVDR